MGRGYLDIVYFNSSFLDCWTFISKLVKSVSICTNAVFLMGKCKWPYGPSYPVDFIH